MWWHEQKVGPLGMDDGWVVAYLDFFTLGQLTPAEVTAVSRRRPV